ncbi:MAG: Glycerol dehydrogenase related protein [Cyanobacteriota bacterium]
MTEPLTSGVISQHAIAPACLLRGPGAWAEALPLIPALSRRPLVLGRSAATRPLRQQLSSELAERGLQPAMAELRFDCCEADLNALADQARRSGCDGVLASGGGKVLDAGKLLAHRLQLPCITVPSSASTCAGWTALANIYSAEGAFEGDEALGSCPALLIFDHNLLLQAPARTLASGIADAMAKWYEASVSSGHSSDGLVQQAVQQARVLRDQLLLDGNEAMAQPGGEAWGRVVEASGLTAGLIGGLGGARCRTVAAHAIHNGLTQLARCHGSLHGEKVGFGVLVQLRLEEQLGGNQLAAQARRQLTPFFRSLGLPVSLEELGLGQVSLSELQEVCAFACRSGSDLHHLPFPVAKEELLSALVSSNLGCPVLEAP